MTQTYIIKDRCRICNSPGLIKYFDFGRMPLANAFKLPGQAKELFIPQEVMYCPECSNSQLSVVVNPEVMFSNYLYFSSVSKTFQLHCRDMATTLANMFKKRLRCLDIASNDGCLLSEFKALGNVVIGVEPAKNISKIANDRGIQTVNEFWGETARKEVFRLVGKVDAVTATNVFAHVDDVHGFVKEVHEILDEDGVFVLEFPYMRNLMRHCEFDTIYHEHLSYFLVRPILKLLEMHDMRIADLSEHEIHGGTIRIISVKKSNKTIMVKKAVEDYLKREKDEGLHDIDAYRKLESSAKKIKADFLALLTRLKKEDKKIIGYGASAKGNVFLNYCRVDSDMIRFIVDDTAAKQGLIYAGTKIPIVDFSHIEKEKPDYIVLLPWNFAKEIMKKTVDFKEKGGKYIIAIPEVKVV